MVQTLEITGSLIGVAWTLVILRWCAWKITCATVEAKSQLSVDSRYGRARRSRRLLRGAPSMLSGWLGKRLRTGVFTGLPLTLMVTVGLTIVIIFSGLAIDIRQGDDIVQLDQTVNALLARWQEPAVVEALQWISSLGDGPALSAVGLITTVFIWFERRRQFILPLWMTFIGAQATTWGFKHLIARARPDFLQGVVETSWSFPSGHATAATALYGFLAYILARDLASRRHRFEIVFWAAALIAAIDVTRVLLSVHYVSDVIAGNLVGLLWILAGTAAVEWSHRAVDSQLDPAHGASNPRSRP